MPYLLITVDPSLRNPIFRQKLSLEEAREFVGCKRVSELHEWPHKWTLLNSKGFVVAAFDSLKMYGTTI